MVEVKARDPDANAKKPNSVLKNCDVPYIPAYRSVGRWSFAFQIKISKNELTKGLFRSKNSF